MTTRGWTNVAYPYPLKNVFPIGQCLQLNNENRSRKKHQKSQLTRASNSIANSNEKKLNFQKPQLRKLVEKAF